MDGTMTINLSISRNGQECHPFHKTVNLLEHFTKWTISNLGHNIFIPVTYTYIHICTYIHAHIHLYIILILTLSPAVFIQQRTLQYRYYSTGKCDQYNRRKPVHRNIFPKLEVGVTSAERVLQVLIKT